MNKKRLLKLADFIYDLPRSKFNLGHWGKTNEKGEAPSLSTCGTAACAVGWMPTVFSRSCRYTKNTRPNTYLNVCSKENSRLSNFKLAERFFGISKTEVEMLFDPYRYPEGRRGNKRVAKRIRDFVAGKKITVSGYGY